MKRINFKKLSIQNFLSVGNEAVVIDFTKGINVITGINHDKEGSRNGVGKSVICDSINFCLFGETLREIKKTHIKNRFSHGSCKILISFDVIENNQCRSFILMRSIDPSAVQLIELMGDEKINLTKSTIPRTNEFICKLINCEQDVFQQSVLMSINSTMPFMAQKKIEKRKFIEGVLRLNIFSEMLNGVRADYLETKKELDAEQNILNDISVNLDKYSSQQKNFEDSKKQQESTLLNRITLNEEEIKDLEQKIQPIDAQQILDIKSNINLLDTKQKEYTNLKTNIFSSITVMEGAIKELERKIEKICKFGLSCDSCERPFTDEDKEELENKKKTLYLDIENNKNQITTHKNKLEEYNSLIDKCEKAKNSLRDKLHNINIITNNNQNIQDKIDHIKSSNKQIKRDIDNLSLNTFDFKSLISESENRADVIKEIIEKLTKKINIQEAAKFVVSEEGVKSYIVKKILQVLNQRLAIYLSKLDANCQCVFNEYFEETIIDSKGHECSYHNFSGGEKKRIDLAILFTFQDIRHLQGDVSFNISMYDELLDSSLDGKGIELVIMVLREKVEKNNEAIYIITHNNHAMNTAVQKTIELVKYNGITKIKK